MKNYTYCALFSHDDYLYPLIALMYSGRETQSQYPFTLIVTNNISQKSKDIVKAIGYNIIETDEGQPDSYKEMCKNENLVNTDFGNGHGQTKEDIGGRHTFTKFKVFDLIQFEKILILDCDILILKNIDDLFDYPSISSVSWYPGDFCSGCMLLNPDHSTYVSLVSFANAYQKLNQGMPYDDYMILKDFFSYIPSNSKHLFQKTDFYNLMDCNTNNPNYLEDWGKIRCIHMTGKEKPGRFGSSGGRGEGAGYPAIMGYNYYLLYLNYGIKSINKKGIATLKEIQ